MGLKIYWTQFSETELRKIFKYYLDKASYRVAKKLVDGIFSETLILSKQPKLGRIEELLIYRDQEFRYILYKNYKIIYWINIKENRIEINDVFDTRQNPIKIQREK